MDCEIFLIRGIKEHMSREKILEIQNLKTEFQISKRHITAVNNISLDLRHGEMIGLVGESGCGKSMTAYSILQIVPKPGRITNGIIKYNGGDLIQKDDKYLQKIRGKEISLVFQDPLSSLNPVYNIFWHFNEVYKAHGSKLSKTERIVEVTNLLKTVGIQDPQDKIYNFPHQFSGGMRQRVVIALALLLKPKIIIADEPTTSLDVTTQRAIFDLLKKLRETLEVSIIVISHDLFLITEQCDRVFVMYAGEIMESGTAEQIIKEPLHPYTTGLINSIPSLKPNNSFLEVIPGE